MSFVGQVNKDQINIVMIDHKNLGGTRFIVEIGNLRSQESWLPANKGLMKASSHHRRQYHRHQHHYHSRGRRHHLNQSKKWNLAKVR